MSTATISSKFQIIIPKQIRKRFNLQPGQKLVFIPYEHSIRVIVVPPIEQGFGFLKGIDTSVDREDE